MSTVHCPQTRPSNATLPAGPLSHFRFKVPSVSSCAAACPPRPCLSSSTPVKRDETSAAHEQTPSTLPIFSRPCPLLLLFFTLTPSFSVLSSSKFLHPPSFLFLPADCSLRVRLQFTILLSFLDSVPDPKPIYQTTLPGVLSHAHIRTSLTIPLSHSHCSHAHSYVVCFRPYLSQLGSRRPLHRPCTVQGRKGGCWLPTGLAVIGGAGTAGTGACPKLGITLFPLSPTDGLNAGSDGLTRPSWFYPHPPPPQPPESTTTSSSRPIVESPPLISCEHDCRILLHTSYLTGSHTRLEFLQQPPIPAAVRSPP
ncbi:hypothetical protein BDP55DRAFT_217190 [Colletotrichum godetiae]|uniref:Uncharacterized protein n=1 Tax=Colletotrichum godetiae TaxID=1209918 RepID=A0AAJ0EYG9_9PEZI|nr:uncharacterized protein BDP55DRAFT_217190 [Colletotrichum godetiae]KAK1700122.1 hypothetical protein BDP55DRAFT_217190 [Colletotrichum godetiae]